MRLSLIICIGLIMSACASQPKHFGSETRDLQIPEYKEAGLSKDKNFKPHECIYDAIDESLATHNLAWWDSGPNNCVYTSSYRGRLMVKFAEPGSKYLCVQIFEYSQMKMIYSWSTLRAKEFVACRPYNGRSRWRISYNLSLLDWMTLQDILQ